jgi:hypothetical protein
MLEVKDSVAVITGGGGGIGLTLAKYWVPRVRLRFFSLFFLQNPKNR